MQIKQYTIIHLLFYTIIVQQRILQKHYSIYDLCQVWMQINLIFIFLIWTKRKGAPLYIISLQAYTQYLLYVHYRTYFQLPSLLSLLIIRDARIAVINQIIPLTLIQLDWQQKQYALGCFAVVILWALIKYQLKKTNDSLIRWRDNYYQTSHSLPVPFLVVDSQSRVLQINPLCQKLLKESNLEIQQNQFKNIFEHPDQLQTVIDNLNGEQICVLNTYNVKNNAEQMNRTILKTNSQYLTVQTLGSSDSNTILTLFIKQILVYHQKLFLITINCSPKFRENYAYQRQLMQSIKFNAYGLLQNLQSDYIKWDNIRSLEIIKESDLKLLSTSVVDLFFLITQFQAYDVSFATLPHSVKYNFKFKSLLIYLIEIFAGKYLSKFEIIDLYFEESLQDNMYGSVGNLSLLCFGLFELIGKSSCDKNTLKVQCKLDQVQQSKCSYQIQIQLNWHLNENLDSIFKSVFIHKIIPKGVGNMESKYLRAILKIMTVDEIVVIYKEQPSLSELQIITELQIAEQNFHDEQIFIAPQIQITFSREMLTHNNIQWKQRQMPKIAVIDKNVPRLQINALKYLPKRMVKNLNNTIMPQDPQDQRKMSFVVSPRRKTQQVIEIVQEQLRNIHPQLMLRVASLIKQRIKDHISAFQSVNFVEESDDSDRCESHGAVSPHISEHSKYSLQCVKSDRKEPFFGFKSDLHTFKEELDTIQSSKWKQNMQYTKNDVTELADFSQIPLSTNLFQELLSALQGNGNLQVIKLIKCGLTDEMLISLFQCDTQISIYFVQYNALRELPLKYLIQNPGSRKIIHYNCNFIKPQEIEAEIRVLQSLNIQINI